MTTHSPPSRQEAASELLRRRGIRGSLRGLAEHLGHTLASHHVLMCDEMEWALRTPNARLIITAPPGSAKSRYATQILPAGWLARASRDGAGNVLVGTHTNRMAVKFGQDTRRIVHENPLELGYSVASDTSAKERWNTSKRREYYAVSVGAGISGIRAGLGVLDDLYPTAFEAYSENYRRNVFEWLMDDFFRRLTPEAPCILVNTRWHDDDHVARLIDVWGKTGTPFRLIEIKAEAEEGDVLGRPVGTLLGEDWEGWDYPSIIRNTKAEMIAAGRAREYQALFQQNPIPDTGDYFKKEWLVPVKIIPDAKDLNIYGASDYAVTSKGGDFTVHVIVGVDSSDNIYLLDIWRSQAASDEWIDAYCDMVIRWKPIEWAEETGQIRSGVGPFLDARARERRAYTFRRSFPTRGDKATRAQSIRGRMAMLGLRIPENAPWRADFEAELLRFPAGKNDDQVDALGLIGQLLDHIRAKRVPQGPSKDASSGYKSIKDKGGSSWRVI